MLHRLSREPLIHFLLLGTLLFVLFQWRGGAGGPGSNRIVVTAGRIQHLAAGFQKTWQRPPTEQELKGLIDDYVREEIAVREAGALGLDRDDTVVRRRLRQKLEFLVEESLDAAPATDGDLEAWLAGHPESYRVEPELSFHHVYFNPDRRGKAAEEDARAALAGLEARGASAEVASLGDPTMLPPVVERAPRSGIARSFGEGFANALEAAEPGRWAGPIASAYGLHLVFVTRRLEGRMPELEEVRAAVERDFLADRRVRNLEALYARLLDRYVVTIQPSTEAAASGAGSPADSGDTP